MFDRVWLNANLCTMAGAAPEGVTTGVTAGGAAPGGLAADALGIVEDGAVACRDGRIAWVGPRAALPGPAADTVDCAGAWILPGLIDCHTHLVFAGDRSGEFEQRLGGTSYADIARAGGGILATVRATRAADEEALRRLALPRLDALLAEGVTTVEIKSGYGLDEATELRQLRVARGLAAARRAGVATTLLAAHAVPPEYRGRQPDYAALVADAIVPAAAREKLADAVDVFCDSIAFTPAETARIFESARAHGLPVKLHADQIADCGGAALAARFGALSADHLEQASAAGLRAMAAAGTVAVLLPGAYYFIREQHAPDIAAMRAAGLRMAVATDMNPGSSPALSLLLMLNLACTLFRLTVAEALLGVTRHAAAALGLADRGMLAPGLRCDLALYRITRPAELCYWLGGNPCLGRVVGGEG
ncbi:imidazolonepropionase [Roseomonas sp. NAR14]|uniref:Imidazolonepropionase n=1 Tax=Roseomonas acroporae TaxID=2937791 RepID=A0A9X1Y591_9PROT|nr:imidazolonepropionase [Roseomonas acroporae]MCK8784474.1 imidazolonepropionase [Roseomonas acroporae]